MLYGAETGGWKKYEELESVEDKFFKWSLRVAREAPGYIVREKTKRTKLKDGIGMKAIKYQEKMSERTECKIVYDCFKDKIEKEEGNS